MVSKQQSSSWADFQPELLGLVLRRLPSHADRVRLRAVCRPWRSNAEMQFVPPPHPWRSNGQMQPFPPPLPWLGLLDGTFLDIASCTIFICQPPVTTDSSKGKKPLEYIADVAFFDGKLYAISKSRNLLILEITGSSGKSQQS